MKDYFDIEQNIDYYDDIGMSSESSLVNNFNLIALTIFIGILHLIRTCMNPVFNKCPGNGFLKKIALMSYKFFTFAIYIRLFLEAILFLFLSTLTEWKNFRVSSASEIISLLF